MSAFEEAAIALARRSLTLSPIQRQGIQTLERLCESVAFKSFAPPSSDGWPKLTFYVRHARGAHDVVIDPDGRIVA